MRRVIFRADDLGYSEGVNYGIERAVRLGVVRSVGVMANMEAAEHGVELLSDTETVLGMHAVISAGAPVLPPSKVASLVDGAGNFKTSSHYKSTHGADIVYEELVEEISAQVRRFCDIVERPPAYLDFHAVLVPSFARAVEEVGSRWGIPTCTGLSGSSRFEDIDLEILPICAEEAVEERIGAIERLLGGISEGGLAVCILHPGYVDHPLLMTSSVTLSRCLDVSLACSSDLVSWLRVNGFVLTDYSSVGSSGRK